MNISIGRVLLSSMTALSLLSASAAYAQPKAHASPGGLGIYSRFDTNADGKISRAEFDAGRKSQLLRFDADKDGKVTIAEIDAFFASHMGRGGWGTRLIKSRIATLKASDLNRDGTITVEEFQLAGDAEFKAADKNGDGVIDANEAQAAAATLVTRAK